MAAKTETLQTYKQHMVAAAKSAGIMPLGFIDTLASIGDWDAFRLMVRRSREFGLMGAVCIHPKPVEIANEEFRPSAEEVEFARKVIKLDDEAAASGRGAFELDGKMVDVPIVNRLRRLLARHEKIAVREARTRAALKS